VSPLEGITNIQDIQYTMAPESRSIDNEDRQVVARIQADNRKFNKFARQMKMSKGR
jgi:transcription factor SPN1